ncbi:MAG: hypothetical protein LBE91_20605 [Tannerella sp.]|jgi:uncharacterized protein (TIGR02145 family)|nr:hypothetical protein [Tannerella sp.]
MKRIVVLFGALAMLGMLLTGCLEERIIEKPDDSGVVDSPPLPPPPPTKYVKVSSSVESTPFPINLANERIGLFVYRDLEVLVENKVIQLENGNNQFEYTGPDSTGFVFGYYPYLARPSMYFTTYNGFLDSIQDQSVTTNTSFSAIPSDLTRQILLVSTKSGTFSFKGETGTVQFRNVLSALQFKITKDPALPFFDNQRITSFQVYPSWGVDLENPTPFRNLAGEYTVDVRGASDNPAQLLPYFSHPAHRIKGEIKASPAISVANDTVVIWALVTPFDAIAASKLIFRLETENSDGSIHYTTRNMFDYGNIARNTITSYNVVLTKENVSSDDLVNESLVGSPANSYIISEPGTFAISIKTPTGREITGTNATWLWASKASGSNSFDINDLIGNIEYDSSKKQILFRVGTESGDFNKGNVILALRDAQNNIVWSWHIWLTDKPVDIQYEIGKFMDRNLGALTATGSPSGDAYGFLYQWGRKDPFVGSDGIVSDESYDPLSLARSHTIINNTVAWTANVAQWRTTTAAGTVEAATRFPMQFISSNATNNQVDWFNGNSNDFWKDTGKTDNDPCPYGYKVPSRNNFDVLHVAYGQNGSNYYYKRISNTHWEYKFSGIQTTNLWMAAGRRQGRNQSPDAGLGGKLKFAGTSAAQGQLYYWTSTTTVAPWTAAGAYRINSQGPVEGKYILNSEEDWGDKADAYSVRCVKE